MHVLNFNFVVIIVVSCIGFICLLINTLHFLSFVRYLSFSRRVLITHMASLLHLHQNIFQAMPPEINAQKQYTYTHTHTSTLTCAGEDKTTSFAFVFFFSFLAIMYALVWWWNIIALNCVYWCVLPICRHVPFDLFFICVWMCVQHNLLVWWDSEQNEKLMWSKWWKVTKCAAKDSLSSIMKATYKNSDRARDALFLHIFTIK